MSSPRRLRVCHVITQLELGGAQQNTLYTVAHLDRELFEVSLIAGPGGVLDDEARGIDRLDFQTSPTLVRRIRPIQDLRALFDLTSRLKALAPDIVHTHSSKAGVVGRLAARRAGVPCIVHTVHGWGFHPGLSRARRAVFIAMEKLAGRATTQWIAVSRDNARVGSRCGIAREHEFEIIHSGVELEAFRSAAGHGALRAELGLASTTPLVGMVACLKPQKSPLDFVAVARRVSTERPDAHFVLAGDGELRDEVESAVSAAGLSGRFHLLGWRRDTPQVIGDLDVLVLTSRHEGLPRVVPEAMAAGKPVVATAVDGTPEAVLQNETGFCRPFGDVDAMAADVVRLLADPELALRLGSAGRRHAQQWDIDQMVAAQQALYLGLCGRPAGRARPAAQGVDRAAHARTALP